MFSKTPTSATIAGTEATITLPGPFYMPGDVELTTADGRTESPLRPLADSVATLRVMDEIRSRCGIAFPGES